MHPARLHHLFRALVAFSILLIADPSIAECDAPGVHVTWRSGIIDRYYVPGEGSQGAFLGAAVCGAYLITPTDWNGVRSYAILGPGQLELRDEMEIDFCVDVVAEGSLAYLAGPSGLIILSVDATGELALVSSLSTDSGRSLEMDGDYVYLATASGLEIIDVSSPAAPVLVGNWNGDVSDVTIEGTRAYVAAGNLGLHSLDISDPSHPFSTGQVLPGAFYRGVESNDGYLYVCRSSQGLTAYDLTDPDAPMQVAYLPALSRGFALVGDYALANSTVGIQFVDFADPKQPVVTGFYRGLQLGKVAMVDEVAYMACGSSGLQAISLGDRANQPPIATLPELANGKSLIRFDDNLALLLGNDLRILSLADPTTPTAIGSLAFAGPRHLGIGGGYAYVVDQSGFHSVDVSIPSAPQIVATIPSPFSVEGMQVTPGRVYLWQGEGTRVATIDISNPSEPTLLGTASVPVWSTAFAALDNTLYFAEEEFEGRCFVWVWDFTDPVDPDKAGDFDSVPVNALAAHGDVLYVGTEQYLAVYDEFGGYLGSVGQAQFATAMYIGDDGRLYTWSGSYHVFSTEGTLTYAGTGSTPNGPVISLASASGYIYATDAGGLHVFAAPCATADAPEPAVATVRMLAYPNPSSGETWFALPSSIASSWAGTHGANGNDRGGAAGGRAVTDGVLELFRADGRLVRSIPFGPADGTVVRWDGRDTSGRTVPSGVVWARARTATRVATTEIRLLR